MVELYSQALAQHGQPALPTYVEPPLSPRSRPDLVAEYPLVLTCAKSPRYCKLNAGLDRGVVCAQHGWWQGCDELDLPPSDPYESTAST